MFDELKPNEKRLLSYAADTAIRVRTEASTKSQPFTKVKIAKGTVTLTRELRSSTKYTAHNSDTAPRRVIVEHPINDGYKIVGDAKPEGSSETLHRFSLALKPNATAELEVDEARPEETDYELDDLDDDTVALIVKDSKPNPALEAAFRKVLAKKAEVAKAKKDIEVLHNESDRIDKGQTRLRENINVLKSSAEEKALVQRYVKELNEQEDRVNALDKQIEQMEAKLDKLEKELNDLIESITLEEAL